MNNGPLYEGRYGQQRLAAILVIVLALAAGGVYWITQSGKGSSPLSRLQAVATVTPTTTMTGPSSPDDSMPPTATAIPATPTGQSLAAQPEVVRYTVQEGDILSAIAKQYGVTAADIAAASGIAEESVLKIGQVLTIPFSDRASTAAASAPTATTAAPATAVPTTKPAITPASTTARPIIYEVKQGDVLSRIAKQFGVTAAEIARANGISEESTLKIGQELTIPLPATPTATQEMTPTPSAPAASPTATPEPAIITYEVKQGDVLSAVAKRYGTTAEAIAEASGIGINSTLKIGQELKIPLPPGTPAPSATPTAANSSNTSTREEDAASDVTATSTAPAEAASEVAIYEVKRGDVLSAIARQYGVTVRAITEANEISNPDALPVGQKLRIPLGASTATPTASPFPTPTATYGPPITSPRPLSPLDAERLQGDPSAILLNWNAVTLLEENEWYLVRLWQGRWPDGELVAKELTKMTSWRPPEEIWEQEGRSTQYYWTVVVTRREPGEPENGVEWIWRPLSTESEVRSFTWVP